MTPREAGIQAFYADESTTNTLQGLNAAFDAYEAASNLRDKFAGQALAGDWSTCDGYSLHVSDEGLLASANLYYRMADAMLIARSKARNSPGKQAADAPDRIWLSAADGENEREAWTDASEGGTEYVRADLSATSVGALAILSKAKEA